jgi:hypothetical protein
LFRIVKPKRAIKYVEILRIRSVGYSAGGVASSQQDGGLKKKDTYDERTTTTTTTRRAAAGRGFPAAKSQT